MELPSLDTRSEEDILQEFFRLAKSYVPQWKAANIEDAGVILAKIFSGQLYDSIKRYNHIPYKNLVYFLNLLGAQTFSSVPASGYVTVKLNDGTPDGVLVPKGSALYGQGREGERVVFETENDFLAIDNEIESVFCCNGQGTYLIQSYEKGQKELIKLFDFYHSQNLHNHRIVFDGGDIVFTSGNAKIMIAFENKYKKSMGAATAAYLSNPENARWFFISCGEEQPLSILNTTENCILFSGEFPIPKSEFRGREGRFIVCDISKDQSSTELSITSMMIASEMTEARTGALYSNDIPLMEAEFLPFGEKFSRYDDFYINCDEVFSKKGANLTISFLLASVLTEREPMPEMQIKWRPVLKETDFSEPQSYEIYIEQVLWEYWNGNGWSRLFQDHRYENIFKVIKPQTVVMSFPCPKDIEPALVGAKNGYWIRARILSTNQMSFYNTRYCAPIVHKISLSYSYQEGMATEPFQILEEKERELQIHNMDGKKEWRLCKKQQEDFPSAYFKLKNPIKGGPIKLFFQKEGQNRKDTPSLKWQYWGKIYGVSRWIALKTADETEAFGKSGILSFLCTEDFAQLRLFGEEGYWLRAVNLDNAYEERKKAERDELPIFSGIYFNTVKVVQTETMEREYFYTMELQPSYTCQLSRGHVVEAEVWVNEAKELIGKERYVQNHAYQDPIAIQADDKGLITQYWVKWERVEALYCCGPTERGYVLKQKEGSICFGDGIHGKIPSISDGEGIRVDYKITAGETGNFAPLQIDGFADAIPFVTWVKNLEPISGGCDDEKAAKAIERSMKTISHQNRAVSAEDYVILVKAANRNIIDVKVVFSAENEQECIKIAILPKQYLSSHNYFDEMKHNVIKYLSDKAPFTLVYGGGIHVFETEYIEYCVNVKLTVQAYNDYHSTYKKIEELLETYLNPITGNYHRKGFPIGTLPTKMKLYNYLKNINTIQTIESLNIFCYERIQQSRREIDYDSIFDRPFAVPVNGIHEIQIDVALEL